MNLTLSPNSLADYATFLRVKSLPVYRFEGRTAIFPDEYAQLVTGEAIKAKAMAYKPIDSLFDYQRDIARVAIEKGKYACFADCGLGKTLILTEFAKHAMKVLPKGRAILIVSPLMVIEQTMEEVAKWYGSKLPIKQIRANELAEWMQTGGRIGITNYEALHEEIPQGRLGALILDECFAAGTPIDVIRGGEIVPTHIETVLCGDTILNASGADRVVATKKREVKYAIAVNLGKRITCSPNHPFFTQRGWVGAQDLEPGDSVLQTGAAMRMVRDSVYSEGHARPQSVLREILLSEMAHETAAISGGGAYAGSCGEAWSEEGGMVSSGQSESRGAERADSRTQSDDERGHSRESLEDAAAHEPQTFRAWWQREWLDATAADTSGCTRTDLEGGICLVTGPAKGGLSVELQARLGAAREQSVYRSGWNIAPLAEGSGREENRDADFARVEGIEILEQGHPELERLRASDGKLYFYDLEAERHPSFSVSGLLVHNSSLLKSHYGKWGAEIIRLGKGLDWKLALTGTPAPNDRIEFANHAVFLDQFPTVNSFLAKFFVNRGQTDNRWELKAHAIKPFYQALSHWAIFLTNPAVYGWKDNCGTLPPINVHVSHVPSTTEQRDSFMDEHGALFVGEAGGIGSRGKIARLGKGFVGGERIASNKTRVIQEMVHSWPEESTIIWCKYNQEQDDMAAAFPEAGSLSGDTPMEERRRLIAEFKAGTRKILVSKSKIMGFGLNLQICTRMVFSGLQDSYEEFYQCVKRANRYGSTRPLNVHIPVTEYETPMIETVLDKAHRVADDAREQELIFAEARKESRC